MADLEVKDSEINAKNLLRIKADVKKFIKNQDEIQQSIDDVNARIESEGPDAKLEGYLKNYIKEQHSVCTRANLAVSIIGLSIEDLTESSRNPPSIMAIRDLLESMDTFTDERSIKILREALVVIQNANLSSFADILEDLEGALKSLSGEDISRTTKILQATQLAVRDLAIDDNDRMFDRWDRRIYGVRKSASASASDMAYAPDQPGIYHSGYADQNNHSPQDPSKVLDAPSLHRYIDSVLRKVSVTAIVGVVQNLIDELRPARESVSGPGSQKSKEANMDSEKKMERLTARIQALEDRNRVKDANEVGVKVKEEDKLSQTEKSLHSSKRSFPSSEDRRDVKRYRS